MATRIAMRQLFILVFLVLVPSPGSAQEAERADSLARELERVKARLDSLQRVLEQLVRQGQDTAVVVDELEALRAAAREAAGAAESRADTTQQESRTRNLNILNPELSVTGDIVGNAVFPEGEDGRASAVPREFEFSFQAALDPYTRTKIFVSHEQDFEIAGFPEEEEAEESGKSIVEIEEGYLYWVGLPGGLGLKVGKFRQDVGLYNRWHTHALLEVERPLASIFFLGEDGLIQTGGAITLPALAAGPSTHLLAFEVTAASNDALFGGSNQLSYLARFQSFWDLSRTSFVQFGATGVYGTNSDAALKSRLGGLDAFFRWTPSAYKDLQIKGEWFFENKDVATEQLKGDGGYVQANLRLSRQWVLGTRADFLSAAREQDRVFQLVPSITWWQSEWVRVRAQYNYLKLEGVGGNHTLLLQFVWAFGPHKHETY